MGAGGVYDRAIGGVNPITSFVSCRLSVEWLPELTPLALDAFGRSLADMSASVSAGELRLGFAASVALRSALLRDVMLAISTPGGRLVRGSAPDEPSETATRELVGLVHVLLDAADEALGSTGD